MNKLWVLLCISLVFAYIIENRDRALSGSDNCNIYKDRAITLLFVLFLGVYSGLRIWYNDTITYLQMYSNTPLLSEYFGRNISHSVSEGIGFHFLNSVIKTLGFSSQDFIMFYGVLTAYLYVRFIRTFSKETIFSVFLMITTGFYIFSFAAIKQSFAIGLCLVGLEYLVKGHKVKFLCWVIFASLFHPYAIIYILLIFFNFNPNSKKTATFMFLFIILGFSLRSLLGVLVSLTERMGAGYTLDSFMGEGVNVFRVMVCFAPFILFLLFRKTIFSASTEAENILYNTAILNALLMFCALFGTANYFARLANYFLPAQVIVVPWMIRKTGKNNCILLTFLCVIGYVGYFVYGNLINNVFDAEFAQISFWTYISSHFK